MAYDVPNATEMWNQTGYISFIANQNSASGQMIAFMMLAAVFVIAMVLFSGFTRNARLTNSAALTTLSSALLAFAGVVPYDWVAATFGLTILFYGFSMLTDN